MDKKVKLPAGAKEIYLLRATSADIFIINKLEKIRKQNNLISQNLLLVGLLKEYEHFKITKDTKLLKLIKKICSFINYKYTENIKQFENELSLLDDTPIEGTLAISIHPLDYLTMSHNDAGWTTCMRTKINGSTDTGGSRKRGVLELMNSPSCVTAYIYSRDFKFDGVHSWRNKRWRQNFYITEDYIISDTAYPYNLDEITKKILKILSKLAEKRLKWHFGNPQKYQICDGESLVDYQPIPAFNAMYSNLVHAKNTNADSFYYCKNRVFDPTELWDDSQHTPYYLGSELTCLCCGEPMEVDKIDGTSFVCPSCANGFVCVECGEWQRYDLVDNFDFQFDTKLCNECKDYVDDF